MSYCLLTIYAGGVFEAYNETGLAHLLEHMLFRGPHQGYTNLVKDIEGLGGDINAYTTKEYIQLELSCTKKRMPKLLPLFLDLITSFSPTEASLEKEKQVVFHEISEDKEDPEIIASEALYASCFSTALGASISGDKKSLGNIKLKTLMSYFKRYFTANRMILVTSANFKIDRLYQDVAAFAEKIKTRSSKQVRPAKAKRSSWTWKPTLKSIKKGHDFSYLYLAFKGNALTHPDYVTQIVLEHYMTDGMSSILYELLRNEESLVYSVGAGTTSYSSEGIFEISCAANYDKIKHIKQKIFSALEAIQSAQIDMNRFKMIKETLVEFQAASFDDQYTICEHLAQSELYFHQIQDVRAMQKEVKAISREMLQKMVKKLLKHKPVEVLVY